uniref:Secreted protein n=1 Tax=Steinernema glaseri TaxID=37863 RepID=A0A1I7XXJ8_9BILA
MFCDVPCSVAPFFTSLSSSSLIPLPFHVPPPHRCPLERDRIKQRRRCRRSAEAAVFRFTLLPFRCYVCGAGTSATPIDRRRLRNPDRRREESSSSG